MKRKIYGLLLLLALVLCIGCNKNKKDDTPTPPAQTATPTPTPANLAKTNLDKLPEQFDKFMSYQPQNTADTSKGLGYDVTLKIALGQQIMNLLELNDIESISAIGTVDSNETMAANFDLCINDDKIMNAHLFADSTNLLFNLPDYSANYAAISWEDLLSSVTETGIDLSEASALTGDSIVSTISTVGNNTLLSNAALTTLLRNYAEDFTELFVAVDGTTENFSIGTGDYLLAGKKYTVRANISDLYAFLESLEAELKNYSKDVAFDLEEIKTEGATSFFLDYYSSENGDYAWAAYPDNKANEPIVFINTALGFCLYHVSEDGTVEIALYSEKTTGNSGTITIPSSDEDGEDIGTIDYEYSDTSFAIQAMIDTVVLTLEASKINDIIRYDVTIITGGMSFAIQETIAPTYVDMSCSLASYGFEYLTISLSADSRDYEAIPVPQNTVAPDAWLEQLNQEALLVDVIELLQKYPTLATLLLGSEGPSLDDTMNGFITGDSSTGESSAVSEDYTGEFTSFTGYSVTDGFVDFYPPESEVLALGHPSTGLDTMAVTDSQKKSLLDYAEKSISNCNSTSDTFYWIWGTVEFDDIKSYYIKDYYFNDTTNETNSIILEFDAVSGEFSSVNIFHENKETALQMANDILALLDVNYTITAEAAETYTFAKNLSFSGYDGYAYGDDYYNLNFSVYYPQW